MAEEIQRREGLPEGAKILRDGLYMDGSDLPDLRQKLAVYCDIITRFPETATWYTRKKHLTWCSGKATRVRRADQTCPSNASAAAAQAKLELLRAMYHAWHNLWTCAFNPTFTMMDQWASEVSVPITTMAEAVRHIRNASSGMGGACDGVVGIA